MTISARCRRCGRTFGFIRMVEHIAIMLDRGPVADEIDPIPIERQLRTSPAT